MATVSEDMLSDDDFQQENPVNQAPNRRYMDDDVDDFLDETENDILNLGMEYSYHWPYIVIPR